MNTFRACSPFVLIAAVLAAGGGCTSVNEPLNPTDSPVNTRRLNHTHAALLQSSDPAAGQTQPYAGDGWFVGLAISGGGLRSANFSAAVMFELQRLGLLEKVDAISAVSGGSLTAAYYCLCDDNAWNPGNLQRKMTHPFADDMWGVILQPWNLVLLALTDWDRFVQPQRLLKGDRIDDVRRSSAPAAAAADQRDGPAIGAAVRVRQRVVRCHEQ